MAFWDVFFEDGNINTIIGRPKMGKTNVTVDMATRAIERGYNVYSNIIFFKPWNVERAIKKGWLSKDIEYQETPKSFQYVPIASELILKASSTEPNVIIIDEAGTTASAYKALSNTAVQMRYLGYNIRKIGGCLIIIAQAKRSVVPDLREELVNYEIHLKRNLEGHRDLEILKRHETFNYDKKEYDIDFLPYDTLEEVPLAYIPYDTKSTAGFIWDVNLYDIYYEIVLRNYDAFEARENLPEIIRDLVLEKQIQEYMKHKKFMRTGTAGDLLNTTSQTIRNWIKEGKLNAIQDEKGNYLLSLKEIKKYAKTHSIDFASL